PGDIGLGGDQVEKLHHRRLGVEHALVHVDVDDLGAVFHLLARDGERRLVVLRLDQLAEFRRAGDVGALADIDEDRKIGKLAHAADAVKGSRPERRSAGGITGILRGFRPRTLSAMARIWSGVVPQQPPTMLTSPASAHSRRCAAVACGASSYSPNWLGRPALG